MIIGQADNDLTSNIKHCFVWFWNQKCITDNGLKEKNLTWTHSFGQFDRDKGAIIQLTCVFFQWMLMSAALESRLCCIFTVWLLPDCYPAVFQNTTLCQVIGLPQRKSSQANPLRSLPILSATALHQQPSVTHTAKATHTYNELFQRYRDGHMHISPLLNLGLMSGGLMPQETLD